MSEVNASSQTAPLSDEEIRKATVGEPVTLKGPITLVEYDRAWPVSFAQESSRIREALGDRLRRIEHVGSTSVPGLVAKPIVDMLLVVADSSDEPSYVPPLERAGYVLRVREPEWHQHRMFKGPAIDVNLHVFSEGSTEIERMLLFRDWLRQCPEDRNFYARTKRHLAQQHWTYVQNYADAKSAVVEEIIGRAKKAEA